MSSSSTSSSGGRGIWACRDRRDLEDADDAPTLDACGMGLGSLMELVTAIRRSAVGNEYQVALR